MPADESQPEPTYEILVPEQGVHFLGTLAELRDWLVKEQAWFSSIGSLLDEAFVFENTNFGNINIRRNSNAKLNEISTRLGDGNRAPLDTYVEQARALRVIIGQGDIGKEVNTLIASERQQEAKWLSYIFSVAWIEDQRILGVLAPFRAAAVGNPKTKAIGDIATAEAAKKAADEAKTTSLEAADNLAKFIKEKTELLTSLEQLYRTKLVLEEPAKYWSTLASQRTGAWRTWLTVFGVLAAVPFIMVFGEWERIAAVLERLTTTSTAGISLGGVAVVTVPALFYAWLLKNVSRLFVQNLNLADDAEHRRALAITYLGLAENPKLAISDNDRALILNALFRPLAPHHGDEGPPSGLIELIRGKE